jgi:guanosine-3',5'-bis(diphosphate) 3'-pyrophosphohydrolase
MSDQVWTSSEETDVLLGQLRLDVRSLICEEAADRVCAAAATARKAHAGQLRDGGQPYVVHPLRVALCLLREVGVSDVDLLCAALLHDVLEDRPSVSVGQIAASFGARVATVVANLTKPEEPGASGDEIRSLYLGRLRTVDEDSKLVKLALGPARESPAVSGRT